MPSIVCIKKSILSEEVFIKQPPPPEPAHPHYVCKLHKAIYGLRQAKLQGHGSKVLALFCLKLDFLNNCSSMFIYHSSHGMALLLLYVDDII
jgi:histone deacetylase 1/2